MNTSKKDFKFLMRRLLCAFSAVLIGTTVGSMYASANPESTPRISEIQQAVSKVEGVVTDASGDALIGVSVAVKGTTNGTVTDIDGRYSLNINTQGPATITFTYVGYKPQSLAAKSILNVVMAVDAQIMDEVVVIGYGTQKKENLTGAVSTVDIGKTLEGRPIADVGRGLQGTVPGLSVVLPSGEVGSDPVMKIRGAVGSLYGGSSPLILVDNVEIPSIQLVNPDDIESISVLKDAASTSIYGSKAAFGVILITTKRGAKNESVSVSYSANFAFQNIAKKYEMAGVDGLEYSLHAMERAGSSITGVFWRLDRTSFERSKEWVNKYGSSVKATDPIVYGRDWYRTASGNMGVRIYDPYETMIREWSPTQTHNLSVNGKSGKTSYHIGLGYLNQNGMIKPAVHDDFQRYNASLNITSELNKYITIRGGAMYSDRNKRYPASAVATSDPWYYMYRWSALSPIGVREDGEVLRDPTSEIRNTKTANNRDIYTNINFGATVNLTKSWNVVFDYTFVNSQAIVNKALQDFTALDSWSNIAAPTLKTDAQGNQIYVNNAGDVVTATDPGAMPAYKFTRVTYNPPGGAGNTPDQIYRSSRNTDDGVFNVYSTYNLKLGKDDIHAFKFMLGLNRITQRTESNETRKTDLLDFTNPQFDLATGNVTGGGAQTWQSQLGYFGRVNYSFSDKYLLEGNLRYDGSSKFPKHLKWRWFPSFSGGWVVTNENFMLPTEDVLSFMKLRASWGSIGDQSVPSNLYVPIMSHFQTHWLSGDTRFDSFRTPPSVDRDITWQTIQNLNLGVDLRFFKNKLGITYEWFQRDTKDMIIEGDALPYTFGTSAPRGNHGNLRTRGWELAIDFNHKFSNGIGVNAMATLSDATTVITQNADYKTAYDDRTLGATLQNNFTGKRWGDIYGYRTDRLYQKEDFEYDASGNIVTTTVMVDGVAKTTNKLKGDNPVYQAKLESGNFRFGPGDVKFVDLDGSGQINPGKGTLGDMGDLEVIGNSTPRYEYGFRLGADYKGIDVSVFIQGVGKRDVWGNGPLVLPGFNSNDGAMPQAIAGNFWKEDRTDAFYPRPWNLSSPTVPSTAFNMVPQSKYLLNMAYTRLKNITVGYSLPNLTIKKVGLTKARVYVALENFFTFDNLKGIPVDPEVITGYSMFNSSNYNSGRTGAGAPTFKTASFGVQLGF